MFFLVPFKWDISFLVLSREFMLLIRKSCFSESVVASKDLAICEEILSDLHVFSPPGLSEKVFRTYHENRPSQFVIMSFSSYIL